MRVNQCKALKLHFVQCSFNRYLTDKSPEEAPNKLPTVGKMTSAHKLGKALINVLFQLAVRKRIRQRSADICTRKKLLISYRPLMQKQKT